MENSYRNTLNSERTVELAFLLETFQKYQTEVDTLLDVGGVATRVVNNRPYIELLSKLGVERKVADFRPCDYRGDFVTYGFGHKRFNAILFLSSLEHFPQCTEGDHVYRQDEDIKGFQKALSILTDNGLIFLTVPFGKQYFEGGSHQNYNMEGIERLTEGSTILESYTYSISKRPHNNPKGIWKRTYHRDMLDMPYPYGVGCFVLRKD